MNKWLLVILYFCCLGTSFAVEVTDLYQAKIAVESQSSKDRNVAIKDALRSVILKVGGQSSAFEKKEITKAISQYLSFLSQYSYERDDTKLYIVANFNEEKINLLFQQANLPLWGNLRPQILVWLIEEEGLLRQILPESANSVLPHKIIQFSELRGLPIVLPLMDLEDQLSVNVSDLWGRFSQEVKQLSSRYSVDASLVIRLSKANLQTEDDITEPSVCEGVLCQQIDNYVLDWSLVGEKQQFSKTYQGINKETLLNEALEDVANVIYQQYAGSTELSNELFIDVANVDSLATYVELVRFLQDLSAVDKVTLIKAQQQNRTFKLSLLGSKNALIASFKLISELEQYSDPLAPAKEGDTPIFYWRGQ